MTKDNKVRIGSLIFGLKCFSNDQQKLYQTLKINSDFLRFQRFFCLNKIVLILMTNIYSPAKQTSEAPSDGSHDYYCTKASCPIKITFSLPVIDLIVLIVWLRLQQLLKSLEQQRENVLEQKYIKYDNKVHFSDCLHFQA